MISVIVVDDHPLIRSGLRAVLELADDIELLREGSTGQEAIRYSNELAPDVLVLDVNLPDMNGDEVVLRMRRSGCQTPVLALTVLDNPDSIFRVLESGVNSYLLKDESSSMLLQAVRATARGETWLSPRIAKVVVDRALHPFRQATSTSKTKDEKFHSLSKRELMILKLIAQGLDNEQIAENLKLTPRTIQNHVSKIYTKLGVSSRTASALYAIRNNLIEI